MAALDPNPSLPFTGDPACLNYLLQTRGLVSAFGTASLVDRADVALQPAESARLRRANMNTLNQRPNGWDGGRSQNTRANK